MKVKEDKHHILPASRFPGLRDEPSNKVRVNGKKHAAYHMLFGDMTPEEIIVYLNRNFWGDHYEIEIILNGSNGSEPEGGNNGKSAN